MESCLEAAGSCVNKLELNLDETDVLLVWKSVVQVLDCLPVLTGIILPLQEQVHSLGILTASPGCQVVAVASGIFAQLYLLCCLQLYLSNPISPLWFKP